MGSFEPTYLLSPRDITSGERERVAGGAKDRGQTPSPTARRRRSDPRDRRARLVDGEERGRTSGGSGRTEEK